MAGDALEWVSLLAHEPQTTCLTLTDFGYFFTVNCLLNITFG